MNGTREHCRTPQSCKAITPGKHCVACAAASPDCRARKSAAVRQALADPEVLARKQAAARRVAADPEVTAKKTATMRATHALPEVKARHRAGCQRGAERRQSDPVKREQLRQAGLSVGAANLRLPQDHSARERAARNIQARHLAWCPREYWPLNARLKAQGFRLAERKSLIDQHIKTEARRAIAERAAEQIARRERELAQAY